MTLSNFDWTDKNSVRWFLMLPMGHEGPYSLELLEQRLIKGRVSGNLSIWAEGLDSPVGLSEALAKAKKPVASQVPAQAVLEDVPPPLPPLPGEDISRAPEAAVAAPEAAARKSVVISRPVLVLAGVIVTLIISQLLFHHWLKSQEQLHIKRQAKMDLELHQKIQNQMEFEGWNKKIFFKEYVASDLSLIWLVSASFQRCQVEASFESVENRLLSRGNEKIAFKSKAELAGHVAEFSVFEFSSGNKIIPGLYEVDIKADNCQWDGLIPKLANKFRPPDETYTAHQRVILYAKGPSAYSEVLDKLTREKMAIEIKTQNQEELFWQDLQLKFDTLLAVTLQIEHLFLDFLQKDAAQFKTNLKTMVTEYTKSHGQFLTEFVVSNQSYFKELSDLKNLSLKRNYEAKLSATAKRIGFETMKYIEEFQGLKSNPNQAQLTKYTQQVKSTYKGLKEDINQKIIQSTEDRAN